MASDDILDEKGCTSTLSPSLSSASDSSASDSSSKSDFLGSESIFRLLVKLSIPAMVGLLIFGIYSVIDSLFIGQATGSVGLAGLAVSFPAETFITSLSNLIGLGTICIGRSLGAGDPKKAGQYFGNLFFLSMLFGFLIPFSTFWFLDPILLFLGATDQSLPPAREYMQVLVWATFGFCLAYLAHNALRTEGAAKLSMVEVILSSLVNASCDAIFIFGCGLGLRGAGMSTLIATLCSGGLFFLFYYLRGKSPIQLSLASFLPRPRLLWDVIVTAAPSSLNHFFTVIISLIINRCIAVWDPNVDVTLAAYSIANRIHYFIRMPLVGTNHGFLTISSYNLGAKYYHRVREGILKTVGSLVVLSLAELALVLPLADYLAMIFGCDAATQREAARLIRILSSGITGLGIQLTVAYLFQSLKRPVFAFVFSLLRTALLIVSFLALTNGTKAMYWAWIAYPLADGLSFLISIGTLVIMLCCGPLRIAKASDSVDLEGGGGEVKERGEEGSANRRGGEEGSGAGEYEMNPICDSIWISPACACDFCRLPLECQRALCLTLPPSLFHAMSTVSSCWLKRYRLFTVDTT